MLKRKEVAHTAPFPVVPTGEHGDTIAQIDRKIATIDKEDKEKDLYPEPKLPDIGIIDEIFNLFLQSIPP
jgi:hypothetical protein